MFRLRDPRWTGKQYVIAAVATILVAAVVLTLVPFRGLPRAVASAAVTVCLMGLLFEALAATADRRGRD